MYCMVKFKWVIIFLILLRNDLAMAGLSLNSSFLNASANKSYEHMNIVGVLPMSHLKTSPCLFLNSDSLTKGLDIFSSKV